MVLFVGDQANVYAMLFVADGPESGIFCDSTQAGDAVR